VQPSRLSAAALLVAFSLTACGGGGGTSTPHVTPTIGSGGQPPTGTGVGGGAFSASAFTCPSSDTAASAVRGGASGLGAIRRLPPQGHQGPEQPSGLIAVTYDRSAIAALRPTLALHEQSVGASLVRNFDFPHAGLTTRVLSVAPERVTAVEASLRSQPGVRSVGPAGGRRFPTSVNAPYFTNDPYFNGFSTTVPAPGGGSTPPPATYHVRPYDESQNVPGQWGMHAIGLEYAYEYSQPSNGSAVSNPNALGSSGVKIAIIDTGTDTTHPELNSKIASHQRCFITNPNNVQSTSNFTTDPSGHGTDVAGIAAAASNNGLGFTGSGGQSVIYDYRVGPTPDDACSKEPPPTTDQQCSISTSDIAAAIADAIAQKVNVISLSLGGGGCTNGVDQDATERAAIADAIAANIVVVAASGNDAKPGGTAPVTAPACDSGVIAAGASALADGQLNGDKNSNGTAAAPLEYVASYSNSGSPGALPKSAAAWGIVAPGGDPNPDPNAPVDNLQWIENIWTSMPFDSKFAGNCAPDYDAGAGSTPDCRVIIAGTSMSAPTVAGASALILAVNSSYQSPSAMKQLLCTTADDIRDGREGCGRLNVYRAMAVALRDPTPP